MDREVHEKQAQYQAKVKDLMESVTALIPVHLDTLKELGVPGHCAEALSDRKFFLRIIEAAPAINEHLDALRSIRQRIIENDVKLPKVDYRGTPDFWNRQLIFNNDDSNDRHILRRIYELGWEFSQRRSQSQEDMLMSLIKSDDFFATMREQFLGSAIMPPKSFSFLTDDQWRASPDFGYKQLVSVVYRRVRSYITELSRLLRVQQDLLNMRQPAGFPALAGGQAPPPRPKTQSAINSMMTPKLEGTLIDLGGTVECDNASGSKLAFSGPPPSANAGHGFVPPVKHGSKQTDLFAAFHGPKSRAEERAEIDLTRT